MPDQRTLAFLVGPWRPDGVIAPNATRMAKPFRLTSLP